MTYNKLKQVITSEIFAYILKRLLQAIVTLFLSSALCFAVIQLAPGSYLDTLSQNPQISQETIQQLEQQFGLDKSALEQYLRWLGEIIRSGNFGRS
ncbi:MAG: ABC transporter permease, partial [Trichodesmium sp. MAG_R03]|nr:ABC transporter permease [Trichodesmium sp. MAG_R03]